MESSRTADEIADSAARFLAEVAELEAAYLFGSTARGERTEGSDLDLGLLFDSKPGPFDLIRLQQRLEDALHLDVDVVDLASADAFFALDIVRGRRIFCRDETACDEFELYVLRRAGDLAPFERARRQILLEGVA